MNWWLTGIGVASGVGLWLLWRHLDQVEDGPIGFMEWVKNPSIRKRRERAERKGEATIEEFVRCEPEQIVALLKDDNWNYPAKLAIQRMGRAAAPALLDAVRDEVSRRPIGEPLKHAEDDSCDESGLLKALFDCLEGVSPPEAVPVVAPLARDPSYWIRAQAALLLGSIGTDEAVAPIEQLLKDPSSHVRTLCIIGIERAARGGRIGTHLRQLAYKKIAAGITEQYEGLEQIYPQCLFRLDRERAVRLLASDEVLSPEHRCLHYALEALREGGVVVEEAVLLRLWELLEPRIEDYPHYYSAEQVVQMLAKYDSPQTDAVIERATQCASPHVRLAAAKAQAVRTGLDDPVGTGLGMIEELGWDGVPTPVAHACAVMILHWEVDNGGFTQYFVNSSGDQWDFARAGLQAIGAKIDVKLLDAALSMFRNGSPSTNNDKRHKQLARVCQRDDHAFAMIESKFWKDADDRVVLVYRYILANAECFRVGRDEE